MLFTTSCAVKKLLLDYLGTEQTIPAKPLLSATNTEGAAAFSQVCSSTSETQGEEASMITSPVLKIAFALLVILSVFHWIIFPFFQRKTELYSHDPGYAYQVPIYLRLGQLIYYA